MAKNPTQTTTAVWLALALVGMREANLPTPATTMAAEAVGLFAISNSWYVICIGTESCSLC